MTGAAPATLATVPAETAGRAETVSPATDSRGRGILDPVPIRTTSAVFVGRDAELAQLRDALKRARGGEPAVVLVGGEAGVGKTRLVEEFRRHALSEGAQVLSGQCLELGEDGLPFAPFAAVLRDLLRRDGLAAFAGYEQEFARLLPELGPAGPEAISEANRGHLFDLVTGLFERLSAGPPLVLVIEDLHWADRSTRDLIRFMVRSARTARALLIGTYRSDELHRGHPLRSFLGELDRVRVVERLELDRFDRDGTAAILGHLLGREPTAALVDNIYSRAQGNAFFIEELAACHDEVAACPMPDSVRDLLLNRVDQLAEPAQRVLRIAAAGGLRISHRLLAEVAGLPEAELEEALRAAVAAQLVVAQPDGDGYEFRHALVREAVHDDLLPGEHARLHARYAAAIEARPELVGAGRAPAELAHHWYAAHDHPRALTAALHAATDAGHHYAYAEKSRLLERVLELWEQVPDAAERTGSVYPALLEMAATAANHAGDHVRALALTRAVLAEIDADAEPLRAARLLVRRAKLLTQLGKSDGAAELRRAYELTGRITDPGRRAVLLADLATQMAVVDRRLSSQVADEAAALARQVGDAHAEVSAAITIGAICARLVSAEEGMIALRRIEETTLVSGDTMNRVRVLINASDTLFELGRYDESAETAQRGIADAWRVGVGRTDGVFLLGNLAEALVALGRFDDAEARCREAARLDPPGTLALLWLINRARVRLARGDAGAGETVDRAIGFLSKPFLRLWYRLQLHELRITAALAAGGPDGASAAARAALADPALLASAEGLLAEPGQQDRSGLLSQPRYTWPVLAVAARAATVAKDAELRATVSSVAASLTAQYPAELAYEAQVAAELATPFGAGDAYTMWRLAVDAWRADGRPYQLAWALVRLAEAAAGAGDRAAADPAIAKASALAHELGMAPLTEAIAVLSRRLGLGARPATVPAADVLTGRELEVLRLVAAGRSNRRIAEELYISPKTASVHVSRIIAKLEVSNRGEAAAVAHRLGLI
jgi:predicted ATPase/DNA-binding CsgD family transcriptional regulator